MQFLYIHGHPLCSIQAKVMHVQINDRVISPPEGYLLRKGPGVCHFDFAQEISFSNNSQPQGHGAISDG